MFEKGAEEKSAALVLLNSALFLGCWLTIERRRIDAGRSRELLHGLHKTEPFGLGVAADITCPARWSGAVHIKAPRLVADHAVRPSPREGLRVLPTGCNPAVTLSPPTKFRECLIETIKEGRQDNVLVKLDWT